MTDILVELPDRKRFFFQKSSHCQVHASTPVYEYIHELVKSHVCLSVMGVFIFPLTPCCCSIYCNLWRHMQSKGKKTKNETIKAFKIKMSDMSWEI